MFPSWRQKGVNYPRAQSFEKWYDRTDKVNKAQSREIDCDIECFDPGDRKGSISHKLKALEIAIAEQLTINADNKAVNQQLTDMVNRLERESAKIRAEQIRNQLVQLIYGIMDSTIRDIVPNASSLFGAQSLLKFDQVINSPLVTEEVKIRLRNNATYIWIKKAMKAGNFWNIVKIRNDETHGTKINLDKMDKTIKEIWWWR